MMRNKRRIRFFLVTAVFALISILPYTQSLARGKVDLLRTCTLWLDLGADRKLCKASGRHVSFMSAYSTRR